MHVSCAAVVQGFTYKYIPGTAAIYTCTLLNNVYCDCFVPRSPQSWSRTCWSVAKRGWRRARSTRPPARWCSLVDRKRLAAPRQTKRLSTAIPHSTVQGHYARKRRRPEGLLVAPPFRTPWPRPFSSLSVSGCYLVFTCLRVQVRLYTRAVFIRVVVARAGW